MTKRRIDPSSRLSAEEARRALYIDFEGQKDHPPVLVGVLRRRGRDREPHVWQAVTDPVFADALVPRLPVTPLHVVVDRIVRRAERHDRRIVSWSEHDLRVVRSLADDHPALFARFELRYANARRLAGRWDGRRAPKIGSAAACSGPSSSASASGSRPAPRLVGSGRRSAACGRRKT